jgi:hypothetical protein
MVLTENTGKMFEYAFCMAVSICYNGNYRYDYPSDDLILRLMPFRFTDWVHTAANGARYDITEIDNENSYLSLKTTKRGGKVAPQVIGQPSIKKFCELIGVELLPIDQLKNHIRSNICDILPIFEEYTFDCPILYYNEKTNEIKYIQRVEKINWIGYEYSWTNDWTQNKGSTLKIHIPNTDKKIPICEIQFHDSSRNNMANRWCFENVLNIFSENFDIQDL